MEKAVGKGSGEAALERHGIGGGVRKNVERGAHGEGGRRGRGSMGIRKKRPEKLKRGWAAPWLC